MNPITNYFNAERAESLLFIALGLVALGLAWWAWRVKRTPFWRGAAWPLALVAAIQLVVGGTVWQRSPQDMARAQQSVAQDKPRIASELFCRAARAGLFGSVAYCEWRTRCRFVFRKGMRNRRLDPRLFG